MRCDVSAPRRAAAALGSVGEGLEEATRLTHGTPEGGVVQVLAALVAGAALVLPSQRIHLPICASLPVVGGWPRLGLPQYCLFVI